MVSYLASCKFKTLHNKIDASLTFKFNREDVSSWMVYKQVVKWFAHFQAQIDLFSLNLF